MRCLKVWLFAFFFLFNLCDSYGISNAVIAGKISSNSPRLKLRIHSWEIGNGDSGILEIFDTIPVKDGKFNLHLEINDRFRYATITDEISGLVLLERQYLLDKDSIHLDIFMKDGSLAFNATGKNSERISVLNRLAALKVMLRINSDSKYQRLRYIDSVRNAKLSFLLEIRSILGQEIYEAALTDIYGDAAFKELQYCFEEYMSFDASYQESLSQSDVKAFQAFCERRYPVLPASVCESEEYLNFLYFLAISKIHQETKVGEITFEQIFTYIMKSYTGCIRDKLLGRLFKKTSFFSYLSTGVEPVLYKSLLERSLDSCVTKSIKSYLETLHGNLAVGSKPYNFQLLRDSSDRRLQLSNFSGKVVLLDMYGYLCTGCYSFASNFHKYVYSRFANDTNFVVISVLLESKNSTVGFPQFIERITGVGDYDYTYPEYINLYAARGEPQSDEIVMHYRITGAPFVLLIGKDNRIYSATLPLFVTDKSKNIGLLEEVITNALKEQPSKTKGSQ